MSPVNKTRTVVVDDALISAYLDGRLATNLEQKVAAYLDSHPEALSKLGVLRFAGLLSKNFPESRNRF
jgi:hypothetical protein